MPDKALIWLGSRGLTFRHLLLSHGGSPASSCAVCSRYWSQTTGSRCRRLGPGVREIRIHVDGAHRVYYVATRPEAVYVLHAFEKTTQKTSAHDLRIGRARFRVLKKVGQKYGKKKRG